MSDEIDKHVRRRFDISQRLGKGVRLRRQNGLSLALSPTHARP